MITCSEHSYILISSLPEEEREILDTLQDKKDKILLGGEDFRPFSWEHEKEALTLSTSYFLGTDWLVENRLPLHVQSKLDSDQERLNYLEIFSNAFHALDDFSEADRKEWMKNLFWIDFKAPRIPLVQTQADGLLLFLIVLFLCSVSRIVQKGLKRSFYFTSQCFKNRIKGRIRLSTTLSSQWNNPIPSVFHCLPQEFGVDSSENQILKYALTLCLNCLSNFARLDPDKTRLRSLRRKALWCNESFEGVSTVSDIKSLLFSFKNNPIYKEYTEALSLAKQLIRHCNYGVGFSEDQLRETPPYWINMPKLFELYVYDQLKEAVGSEGKIQYQQHIHYQVLDYLCNSTQEGWEAFVADAKYKPTYKIKGIDMEDARQVSGSGRLTKTYTSLKVQDMHSNIRCLIVYPDNEAPDLLDFRNAVAVHGYEDIYKVGVKLPMCMDCSTE